MVSGSKRSLIFSFAKRLNFGILAKIVGDAQDTPAGNLFEVVSRPKRQTVE